jgi:hypothetical protein
MAFGITLLTPEQQAALQKLTSGSLPSVPKPAPSVSAPPPVTQGAPPPPPVLSTPTIVPPEGGGGEGYPRTNVHVSPYPYALPGGPSLDTPPTSGGIPWWAWAAGAAALAFLVLRRR